jgi:hypothetical protein
MTTPASASASPTTKSRETDVRKKSSPMIVTKTGARFASSVALATDVMVIERCHAARSSARITPGRISSP